MPPQLSPPSQPWALGSPQCGGLPPSKAGMLPPPFPPPARPPVCPQPHGARGPSAHRSPLPTHCTPHPYTAPLKRDGAGGRGEVRRNAHPLRFP